MKKLLSVVLTAAMTVSVVSAISGCSSDSSSVKVSKAESQTGTTSQSATESEVQKPISIGDTVSTDKIKMTFTKAFTAKKLTYSYGEYSSDEKAEDGKVYLITEFVVENISDQKEYISYMDIKTSVDGYSTDNKLIMSKPDGLESLAGDVMPGKKMSGFIAYQIDEKWKECEMAYFENAFSSNATFTFAFTSSDVKKQ